MYRLTQSTADVRYDTKAQVTSKVNTARDDLRDDLRDGAPSNLNTLNELAAAINDDPDFHDTIADSSSLNNRLTVAAADGRYPLKNHNHNEYLTQPEGDSKYYTKAQVNNKVDDDFVDTIIDGAPSNLNTLNELAAAIDDDPNFSDTIAASLGSGFTQSTADGRYRQDSLFQGGTTVNRNGNILVLPVTSFGNNAYRWLKVIYREGRRIFTGKLKISNLVQSFPIEVGIDALYAINDTNDALYTVDASDGTASRVHATNTFGTGAWESLASHGGTLYAIKEIEGAGYYSNSSSPGYYYTQTTDGYWDTTDGYWDTTPGHNINVPAGG